MRKILVATFVVLASIVTSAQNPLFFGTFGTQKRLFVRVYFQGQQPGSSDLTYINSVLTESRQQFLDYSYNILTVNTDIHPTWLQLDITPTCDVFRITSSAGRALSAAGYGGAQLAQYRFIAYHHEYPECRGATTLSAGGKVTVFQNYLNSFAMSHESLHALGLQHAGNVICDPTCHLSPANEPTDRDSIMGNGAVGLTVPEKIRLTWIGNPYGIFPQTPITDVTVSGDYQIHNLDLPANYTSKSLRIPLGTNQFNFISMHVELRSWPNEGIQIHAGNSINDRWWHLASLGTSQSYSFGGVTVEVLSNYGSNAVIRVTK